MKKKITEIPVKTTTTVFQRNEKGERVRVPKEVTMFKEVKVVTGWRRFGHYILDTVCFYVFVFFLAFILGVFEGIFNMGIDFDSRGFDLGARVVSWLILHPFFYAFWEYFFQKTPGKWVTRCRVVDEYGERPTFQQILGRSYARAIPFEAFSCFGDRGWHDTMSNTYLVDEDHLKELQAVMMIDEIGKPVQNLSADDIRPNDVSNSF